MKLLPRGRTHDSEPDPRAELGTLIKQLVANTRRPLRGLAATTHISRTAWSEFQRGDRVPKPDLMELILQETRASQKQADRAYELLEQIGRCLPGQGKNENPPPDPEPTGFRWPRVEFRATKHPILVALLILAVAALPAAGYWWGAASDSDSIPTATDTPVTNPVPERRCALVTVPASPVRVTVDDAKPLKWKSQGDRVRLLDIPLIHAPSGSYEAVAVPKDSPTGFGWMPSGDLTPTSCAGLP